MASEPVRIALVGAGRMGQVHLGALRQSDHIELAGVVEPVARTRAELAVQGIPAYPTADDLLERERDRPEGVLIAAPSDQHEALVAKFAAAGIPMLCEKPLGIRPEQSLEATRSATKAGVLLQVGYWRRFVPELRALRERIRAGELGEISQLSCMQWDEQLPSEQFRAHSGGIAVDMGVHEFDQTRWLLGQEFDWIAAARAGRGSQPRDPTDPDCATFLGQLSGGASATISLGRRFPHADSCWLEVWGTEGYERMTFMWDTAGDDVFRQSMKRQAEAFARAIRGGEQEGADGADAFAALSAAELAAVSLAGGSQVRARVAVQG
jgi:myo-inositol 2-dehydrogenase / D-chiro-inositol 1-dehydrogenase